MKINEFNIKGYDQQKLAKALGSLGVENEVGLLNLARSIWRAVSEKHNEISEDNLAKLVQIYEEEGNDFYRKKKHKHYHVALNVEVNAGMNQIGEVVVSTDGENFSLPSLRRKLAEKTGLHPEKINILSWQEMSDGQFIEEMEFQNEISKIRK